MDNTSFGFRALSWNVGSDYDFMKMNAAVMPPNKAWEGEQEDIPGHRDALMTKLFGTMKADVACLQEAPRDQHGDIDAKRLSIWLGDSTKFVSGENEDTLVAWNPEVFELAQHIETPKDGKLPIFVTIVDLKHIASGEVARFVSGHFTGCMDTENYEPDSNEGTKQLRMALQSAQKTAGKASMVFFGFDGNVEVQHPRMNGLTESGFTLDGEHRPTSYGVYPALQLKKMVEDAEDPSKLDREKLPRVTKKIDHVAIQSLTGALSVDMKFPEALEGEYLAPLGNPHLSPSDHAPLVREVTTTQVGVARRMMNGIKGIFSRN